MKNYFLSLICVIAAALPLSAQCPDIRELAPVADSITTFLKCTTTVNGGSVKLKKITIGKNDTLNLFFNAAMVDYPMRDGTVTDIFNIVRTMLPAKYVRFEDKISIYAEGQRLNDLKSNFYSSDRSARPIEDHYKYSEQYHRKLNAPLVSNASLPYKVEKGLQNRHIALWQSHGWYYEQSLKRWEWQRARILETVEDLYTQSYVLPFLVPMLENAGANVLLPRERDWNRNEVIVDNDDSESCYVESGDWHVTEEAGFANAKSSYLHKENPFKMGTARQSAEGDGCAMWIPEIPEDGTYAVYVSYQTLKNSTASAKYEVRHAGGTTKFSVNQKMGGGTWIYLGKFLFKKGRKESQGVFLSFKGSSNSNVTTADAVKFGGGMGNIARKPTDTDYDGKAINVDFDVDPETSGYPRYCEGSRYWLQWAGFNDTIYSTNRNTNDYNDDYQSRGLWVNTLSDGSYLKPHKKGYNIPLDLSFAFHTDAGTTLDDSMVGTLSIYTRKSNGETRYPNNESRMLGRELADIVQTQIVDDIRAEFEPLWPRRALWDRSYSESRSPEVPAMLLEFLSHQNLADMRYGLDPSFRFCVSRAIYKAMLKYVSYINDYDYAVQPLPVNSFAISVSGNIATLSWRPTADKLEPTATPSGYVVYTRIDDGGFDNGTFCKDTSTTFEMNPGHIYSFKVAATNDGGASFPSEILAAGTVEDTKGKVLVINNFDRVSAPASFASPDSTFAGFHDHIDMGVAYGDDINYIGAQHEFRRDIPWMDDDAPGFGASYANYESKVIAGNTFDYTYLHGLAIMKAGYDFTSASRASIMNNDVKMSDYKFADLICGKEVTTMVGRAGANELKYSVFPKELRQAVSDFTKAGGDIVVSGANIATDVWDKIYDYPVDSTMNADVIVPTRDFVTNTLKYKYMTNYASSTGEVKPVQNPALYRSGMLTFYNRPNSVRYCAESPDGLTPVGENAYITYRYNDNHISAGVAYDGQDYQCVSLGFPIETLDSQEQIDSIIADILAFFSKEH